MNHYRHTFTATCPNNGKTIAYELQIWSAETIMVEDIVAACCVSSGYHENIASALVILGGRQVLKAHHHGVDITTWRGR